MMMFKLRSFGSSSLTLLVAALWCCSTLVTQCEASTDYNRYLAHIFRKYGNGGTMSFEGLEHLMYNLGLGQIEFEPTHTIDEHRPKHGGAASTTTSSSTNNGHTSNTDHDPIVKAYFEKQTVKLLPNEEDDVQVKSSAAKSRSSAHDDVAAMAAAAAASTVDVIGRQEASEMIVREKGIILEFREMHDPKHRHPRERSDSINDATPLSTSNVCLSPKALMHLVVNHDDLHKRKSYRTFTSTANGGSNSNVLNDAGATHDTEAEYNAFINNAILTPTAFLKLCPALLSQIDQQVCMRAAPLTNGMDPKETLWNAWFYATASIFILSACGLLGILLVPLMKSVAYQEILKFLVAVAVGTLSGDALMHLLPHALFNEHGKGNDASAGAGHHEAEASHGHDNMPVWICGCAFATAVFMYILEHLLPLLRGKNGGHGHSHGAKGGHAQQMPANGSNVAIAEKTNELQVPEMKTPRLSNVDIKEINTMLDELKKDTKSPSRPMTPVAFMVIIGDGLHNLTDGLAIGAAFATDPVTGFATAFAVLCHELPHELGDFALLLQTGMPLRRAVYMNIVSSVLSFVGMAIGLFIAGMHSTMTQWIYAATAGSFLYIALADLVPAMAVEGDASFKDVLIQIAGILVGGIIMLVIAVNEEALEVLFK